jgi:hypothetical protein
VVERDVLLGKLTEIERIINMFTNEDRQDDVDYKTVTHAGKEVYADDPKDEILKVEKVIAILSGSKASQFTKFGKEMVEAVKRRKELVELEKKLSGQLKEMVQGLFDAADECWTRTVETAQVVLTLSKVSGGEEPKTKVDYEKLVGILAAKFNIVPEQMELLKKEAEVQVAPAPRSPTLTANLKGEGVIGDTIKAAYLKVKEYVKKIVAGVENELKVYERVLLSVQKEVNRTIGMTAEALDHKRLMARTINFMEHYL